MKIDFDFTGGEQMTFDEYQKSAKTTAIYPCTIAYPMLGLCGEVGEVAEHIKKMIRDDNGFVTETRKAALRGELGDVLWYLANLCDDLQFSLDDIAAANIEKLRSRQERGKLHGSGNDR